VLLFWECPSQKIDYGSCKIMLELGLVGLAIASLILVWGALVRYKKMTWLVFAPDRNDVADLEGLVGYIGRNFFMLAILGLIVALIGFFAWWGYGLLAVTIYILVALVVILWSIGSTIRFESP
jgi:hypothetical protein